MWIIYLQTARGRGWANWTMTECAEAWGVPSKFHPPSTYAFPARKFGFKEEKPSFRAEWCLKYDWLHYDRITDAAFCHLCLRAEKEEKILASIKHDPSFISSGCMNWRDATKAFNMHLAGRCHEEAILATKLPKETDDVGEWLSFEHEKWNTENRAVFRRILQNIPFLACQALPLTWNWGWQ